MKKLLIAIMLTLIALPSFAQTVKTSTEYPKVKIGSISCNITSVHNNTNDAKWTNMSCYGPHSVKSVHAFHVKDDEIKNFIEILTKAIER